MTATAVVVVVAAAGAGVVSEHSRQAREKPGCSQLRRGEVRVRLQTSRHARVDNVGEFQSNMVSKLRIIRKQTIQDRSQ